MLQKFLRIYIEDQSDYNKKLQQTMTANIGLLKM